MLSVLLVVSIIFLATISVYKHLKQPGSKMPPGPWGLPVLGYLPFLNPKAPYLTLSELCDKFGKIFTLQLGQGPML